MKHFYLIVFLAFGCGLLIPNVPPTLAAFSQIEDTPKAVVYPNPAKDYAEVKSNVFGVRIKSVVVYNILGNEMLNVDVNSSSVQLNVIKFKPGKYLVRVLFSDGSEEVLQLIKQ